MALVSSDWPLRTEVWWIWVQMSGIGISYCLHAVHTSKLYDPGQCTLNHIPRLHIHQEYPYIIAGACSIFLSVKEQGQFNERPMGMKRGNKCPLAPPSSRSQIFSVLCHTEPLSSKFSHPNGKKYKLSNLKKLFFAKLGKNANTPAPSNLNAPLHCS